MAYENRADDSSGVWEELDVLVDDVQRARAAVAAAQAEEAALLARAVEIVGLREADRRARGLRFGNDLPLREVAAELGTAMRVGDRTVQRRMDEAHALITGFAATYEAWRSGRIDRQHAMTILDEGIPVVDGAARREYESLVLAVAVVESAGRLREIARVIAARVDPEASALRRKSAVRGRDVRAIDLDDGMARLLADLPAPLAHGIMDRINEFARGVADVEQRGSAPNDAESAIAADADPGRSPRRSLGEIRADVLTDLLLTSVPDGHRAADGTPFSGIRGRISLTIPILSAAGIDDEPALLTGHGPVDSDVARRIMADAPAWNRVLLDPETGAPVAVDRYRPSAALARFVDIRDERCRFPGCTMKPWRCDADHTIAAADGGATSACNLADFCRRHHVLKHCSPWRVEQVGSGRLVWTSPTGRVYTDFVPATLMFVPAGISAGRRTSDEDPPPF